MPDPVIARTLERAVGLRAAGPDDGPETLAVYSDRAGKDVFVIEYEGVRILADERFITFRDMDAVNIDPKAKESSTARRLVLSLPGHERVELPIDGQRDQFLDVFPIHRFLRRRANQQRNQRLSA